MHVIEKAELYIYLAWGLAQISFPQSVITSSLSSYFSLTSKYKRIDFSGYFRSIPITPRPPSLWRLRRNVVAKEWND